MTFSKKQNNQHFTNKTKGDSIRNQLRNVILIFFIEEVIHIRENKKEDD